MHRRGADYYRRNKKFADGTVLVKEVFGTDHAQMTTGDAHWAKDTKVWFVLIKDSKGRYPNNPLWGDGVQRRISAGRQAEIANGFSQLGFYRRSAHPERTERGTGEFSRIPQRLCGG